MKNPEFWVFLALVTAFTQGDTNAIDVSCQPSCLNEGVCISDPSTQLPTCLCPDPSPSNRTYFRGAICQTVAVKCNETWWCENGGTCNNIMDVEPSLTYFNCICPSMFEGTKCQTPVTACSEELWCANGGVCGLNVENNETICKCPSTHTGLNCQTLVEPQELGSPPTVPVTDPPPPPGDSYISTSTEDERTKYFKAFFLVMIGLIFVWMAALILVHWTTLRPHFLKKSGHVLMEEFNLKEQENHRDGPDVEDQEFEDSSSDICNVAIPNNESSFVLVSSVAISSEESCSSKEVVSRGEEK